MDSESSLRGAVASLDTVSRSVLARFGREALVRLDSLGGEAQARAMFASVAAGVLQEQGFTAPPALDDFLRTRGEELFALSGRIVQSYRQLGGPVDAFLERLLAPQPTFSPLPQQPTFSTPTAWPAGPADYVPEEPITTVGQSSGLPFGFLLVVLVAVVGIGTLMALGGRIMLPFALLLAVVAARLILNQLFD